MWSFPRRPHGAVLVDVAVSVSMVAVSTWWWHQFRLGGLIYGVLVGVALLWRRRRPVAVLAAVAVVSALVAPIEVDGTHLHDGMLLVALAVATHAVIAHAASLRTAAVCALATLFGAAALVNARPSAAMVLPGRPPRPPVDLAAIGTTAVDLVTLGALVWAAALSVRFFGQQRMTVTERRQSVERERAQLSRVAVAEERVRIARELHDIVAHSLSVIVLQAQGAEYAFDRDAGRARAALRTIGTTGADALEEIRELVRILRDDSDEPAPDHAVASVVERARAAGATVDLIVEGVPAAMPGGVTLAVYRIVQESLTNALKHAGPAPAVTVRITYQPGAVELDITDNGTETTTAPSAGHGLVGMRERATLYGGTFDAGPSLGGGWRVRARVPLSPVAVPA
jgi:signal transduction histidine kinase